MAKRTLLAGIVVILCSIPLLAAVLCGRKPLQDRLPHGATNIENHGNGWCSFDYYNNTRFLVGPEGQMVQMNQLFDMSVELKTEE